MKRLALLIVFAFITISAGSFSYADIPNDIKWDIGQKTENHQTLVMDAVAIIDIFGIFESTTTIHIETEDTAIYTVYDGGVCTNNSFRNCYDLKTGVYDDIEMDETKSYIDLRDAQGPGLDPPNDITPIDLKPSGIREIEQVWEMYKRENYSDNLGTWRRVYVMEYQLIYKCTDTQGVWNLDVLEPNGSFNCKQSEFGTWKDLGTRTMTSNIELNMTDRNKTLNFNLPIYNGKPTYSQPDTPIQVKGSLGLPLSIFPGEIPIDEDCVEPYEVVNTYDITLDYSYTTPEPIHGVCSNDEQPYVYGSAVNIENPSDIIGFDQWFSLGLEYLSHQVLSDLSVPSCYEDYLMKITGDVSIADIVLTTWTGVDEKDIYTVPSPLCRNQAGDFYNKFFIMGPSGASSSVVAGFKILNVPAPYQGPYTKNFSLGCGIFDKVTYHTNNVPGSAPSTLSVMHGLQFRGIQDIGGTKNLSVTNCN